MDSKTTKILLLSLFCAAMLSTPRQLRAQTSDTTATDSGIGEVGWTSRKTVGLVLSMVIPGSGQTYLGHTEKGALFTLGAFGSSLIAGLSENNVIGRKERLDELAAAYVIATSFAAADQIWKQMLETKDILDTDVRRRDRFRTIAIAIWVVNIIDFTFFSDDLGEKTFGALNSPTSALAFVPDARNGVNVVFSVQF